MSESPKYPITELKLDGFRGLRNLEIKDLRRVNILVGGNSSGKTSVLEAISLLSRPCNPIEWGSMIGRRDLGGLDETLLQSLHWCFTKNVPTSTDELLEASCSFAMNGAFPLRSMTASFTEFFGVPSAEDRKKFRGFRFDNEEAFEQMRGCEISHALQWQQTNEHSMPNAAGPIRAWDRLALLSHAYIGSTTEPNGEFQFQCETLSPYSYQLNRKQVTSRSKGLWQDKGDEELELLKNFDPDILGVEIASIVGDRPSLYIKHKKFGFAPLSIFGDAMRRCVLLAATLPTCRGGVLLIDEIEGGIHAKALGPVFEWLVTSAKRMEVQIICTTHSLEAVCAMAVGDSEEIAAFRLETSESGSTCRRFGGDALRRVLIERGLDLR